MTQHDPYRTPEAPLGVRTRVPLNALDFAVLAAVLVQCAATLAWLPGMRALFDEGRLSPLLVLVFWLATLLLLLAGLLLFLRNRAAPWLFLVAAVFGGLVLLVPWPLWLPHSGVGVALLGTLAGFMQARRGKR